MTQAQLDRAIARRTGETVDLVRSFGFSLLPDEPLPGPDESDASYGLDCPGCGAPVLLTHGPLDDLPELAECDRCDAAYPFAPDEVYDVDDLADAEFEEFEFAAVA